jgi:uncharacterized protein
VKYVFVFFVLLLAVGLNMPDNMLVRFGIDSPVFTIALAVTALTGAIAWRKIGLVLIMLALAVGANLPETVATEYNLDRDILLATLIALIIVPFVQRHLEG